MKLCRSKNTYLHEVSSVKIILVFISCTNECVNIWVIRYVCICVQRCVNLFPWLYRGVNVCVSVWARIYLYKFMWKYLHEWKWVHILIHISMCALFKCPPMYGVCLWKYGYRSAVTPCPKACCNTLWNHLLLWIACISFYHWIMIT